MPITALGRPLAPLARGAVHLAGSVVSIATRVTLAQVFIVAGWGKLNDISVPMGFFAELGIPFPAANAWLVATVEFAGGICLLLGLGTRVAAGLLLATMGVALATAHRAELIAAVAPRGDLSAIGPWVLALLLLWLIAQGAGAVSGDRVLARVVRRTDAGAGTAAA